MLFTKLLQNELDNRRDDFRSYSEEQARELAFYLDALKALQTTDFTEVQRICSENESIGAVPADELAQSRSFSFPFDEKWQNHEQARAWSMEILKNRTTFAADGSQLYFEKETSLPIGAIQIGWFENPHDGSQNYKKNAEFTILSPKDLLQDQEEPMNPETRIGEKRFHAEAAKVAEFLSSKKGWQERGERMPLAFFDGTLLVSFSLPQTALQMSFVQAMVNLVRHSRDCRVPLVGYVDRSFARDLLSMLGSFGEGMIEKSTLYDSSILHTGEFPVLYAWGARTSYCYSDRRGLQAFFDPATGRSLVGFSYLQTTSNAGPARLDIPGWVYEDGLLDEMLDVVRAECVVGLGYPYALETADQTAVISFKDKEIFLAALQEFATREKLGFSVARKAASKNRRR
jgi:hypothetical protein